MIIVALLLLGLCLGSFANALVWRVHEQGREQSKKKPNKQYLKSLSVAKGRSMCPDCKHELGAIDLIPVLSWASTGGKCRYCKKPISKQYPLVELATAGISLACYEFWPKDLHGAQILLLGLWLALIAGLMALVIYDLRWMLLPNRILTPLYPIAAAIAIITVLNSEHPIRAIGNVALSVAIGGGIFFVLFQLSSGRLIGGGDVKLGWLLGLALASPEQSILLLFVASVLGCIASLPLVATKQLKTTSTIPFGPFLIAGAIIAQLFGHAIFAWYERTLL